MGVCQECRSCQYPRHCLFLVFGAFWVGGMNINKDDGFTLVEILIAITIFCFRCFGTSDRNRLGYSDQSNQPFESERG